MNTEILGVILQLVCLVGLSYPLGRYIAKVYKGEKTWSDFMAPIERWIYKFSGINPEEEMNWKQFLKALLIVNLFWFFWGMILLVSQGILPLNPDGNPGQSPDLAFNTCISFMVNCNLQHYSGETGLSYFTQLFVIMLFQFITAACGMAALAGVFKAMAAKTTQTIGNFWVYLVKSTTRILMPLSLLVGILLIINGTPMTFKGQQHLTTLEGTEQVISQGPTAAIVPIKQLGTNGGGYFGVNSSHPLENPNAFTNMLECWSILILPMAMVFALGFYLKRRKLAWTIYGVMLFAYLVGITVSVNQEMGGNPQIAGMGISQDMGSMEGKEVRIGSAASAMWGMTTTVTSNGSVNSMHDSQTPLSGMLQMLNMQINCWFRTRGRTHRAQPVVGLAQQPVVPRPERNALRVHLVGGQQRFGLRGPGRQHPLLEHFVRHRADPGPLFPDRRTGRHRRTTGKQEIHSRKRRHAEDRHDDLRRDDFRRNRVRRRTFVLPGTHARSDRRLPRFLMQPGTDRTAQANYR